MDSYTTTLEQDCSANGLKLHPAPLLSPDSDKQALAINYPADLHEPHVPSQIFQSDTRRRELCREDMLCALAGVPHKEVFVHVCLELRCSMDRVSSLVDWYWVVLVIAVLVRGARSERMRLVLDMLSADGEADTRVLSVVFQGLAQYGDGTVVWFRDATVLVECWEEWEGMEQALCCLDEFTTRAEQCVCREFGQGTREQLLWVLEPRSEEIVDAGLTQIQVAGSEQPRGSIEDGLVHTQVGQISRAEAWYDGELLSQRVLEPTRSIARPISELKPSPQASESSVLSLRRELLVAPLVTKRSTVKLLSEGPGSDSEPDEPSVPSVWSTASKPSLYENDRTLEIARIMQLRMAR
jgi:hypothetical protein